MSENTNHAVVIEHTLQWLFKVVIAENFCPFAKNELEQGRVRFAVFDGVQREQILEKVIDECQYLDSNPEVETTLIIFSAGLRSFDRFLNIVELAEELMNVQDYEGVYQLASFHPDYCFAGIDKEDAANYTNRSPYPMLHLIREESLEKALANYPDPAQIPEKNIQRAREQGISYYIHVLKQIMSDQ